MTMHRLRLSGFCLALAWAAWPALTQAQPVVDKLITVTGEATVSLAPDLAMVRGGVTSQGKTAQEAGEVNAKEMLAVMAALKEAGVEARDIQTARLSIYPQQDANKAGKARIIGFQATNHVNVRLRDMTRIATVLDHMITAGANEISGISFAVSDESAALDAARRQAVADARRKAEIYAQAAGVRLGRAVMIQEEGAPMLYQPKAVPMRAAAAPPVSPGEETLRTSVTVSFELMH